MTIHMKITHASNAPVFALHSSASGSGQWKSFTEEMEGRFDVFSPALPGYDNSNLASDYAHKGMAVVAAPIIREIEKHAQPVHLVGHSQGGGTALKIALMRPDLVKSLTLYEPATFHFLKNGSPVDQKHFQDINLISAVLTTSVASGRPDLGMMRFIDFWNGAGSWNQLSKLAQEKITGQAMTVMSDFANGFSETWSQADLGTLNVPTLMLMGMESPAVSQHVAAEISNAIPGARLALLPSLGHMAPVFQPHWVNPRILEHIASVERPAVLRSWPIRSAA